MDATHLFLLPFRVTKKKKKNTDRTESTLRRHLSFELLTNLRYGVVVRFLLWFTESPWVPNTAHSYSSEHKKRCYGYENLTTVALLSPTDECASHIY